MTNLTSKIVIQLLIEIRDMEENAKYDHLHTVMTNTQNPDVRKACYDLFLTLLAVKYNINTDNLKQ